ncbi:MAG: hypothetical protein JW966_12125 [Anaerolineae bacterium]|nr:hypothetical protein [Anaerolineae bacterium]
MMDDTQRQALAERLSTMPYKKLRKEMRRLDPDADMQYWRNAVWDEYHTLYVLPNVGLTITLVEKTDVEQTDKRDFSGPPDRKKQKIDYQYIEARVAPVDRPVEKSL